MRNEHGKLHMIVREKFRWLLVWLQFTLLSIKLLQFHFWFQSLVTFLLLVFICCLKKKNADLYLLASLLPFHACWQISLWLSSARCCQLPSWIAGGEWGTSGGIFPFLGLSQYLLCNWEPARPLFQIWESAASLPVVLCFSCSTEGLGSIQSPDHATQSGKIKAHPMSCCTWRNVLCRWEMVEKGSRSFGDLQHCLLVIHSPKLLCLPWSTKVLPFSHCGNIMLSLNVWEVNATVVNRLHAIG